MMVWEQDYLCTALSLCTCSSMHKSMHMQLYAHAALCTCSSMHMQLYAHAALCTSLCTCSSMHMQLYAHAALCTSLCTCSSMHMQLYAQVYALVQFSVSVPIFCFVRIFYVRFHFLFHFLFLLHISILFPVPCFSSCPKFASDAIGLYVVFRR